MCPSITEETSCLASSRSSCRELFFRHRWKIGALLFVALGILISLLVEDSAFVAEIWFLGLPLGLIVVRYVWLRLCRDPFLSPSDSFVRICWESITTCPPDVRRTLPTIVFWFLIAVVLIGSLIARSGVNQLNPSWFILFAYNGFGTLVILVCAVWCIDFLWLSWLLIAGKKGAAKNWWWKNTLRRMDERNEESQEEMMEMAPDNDEVGDTTPNEEDDTSSKSTELDHDRRSARIRTVLVLITYIWWTAWALVAAYNPHTLELSIPVPRLPPQCDGYRLAVSTDLHAGSLSGIEETEWMVQHLNSLNPDAIALGGDIGDEEVNDVLRKKLEPLAGLKAPDGVYYSFGNHENIQGIEDFRKLFRTESPFKDTIVTLENEHSIIRPRSNGSDEDCRIVMVGMADWSGTSSHPYKGQVAPDFSKAIRSTPGPNGTTIENDTPVSSSLPMIMMQHQPANMENVAKEGVGLQLSGHTHGGQVWPLHMFLTNFDAISGLHEYDVGSIDGPSYLWVSEGVVGWGPRIRFLCKTDIALLTLRNPEAMAAEGLVPDTDLTIATFALYVSLVLVPLGLLAFSIPAICWMKKRIQDRRSNDVGEEKGAEGSTEKVSAFDTV